MVVSPTPEQAAAAAGADLLDRIDDGTAWFLWVNPWLLEMASCHRCVLGQLFGGYGEGLQQVFGDRFARKLAAHYGMLAAEDARDTRAHREDVAVAQYDGLLAAWCEEIRSRRAGQGLPARHPGVEGGGCGG